MSEWKWKKVNCPDAQKIFGRFAKAVWVEDQSAWHPEWKAPKSLELGDLSGMKIKIDLSNGKSVVFWNSEWGGINAA